MCRSSFEASAIAKTVGKAAAVSGKRAGEGEVMGCAFKHRGKGEGAYLLWGLEKIPRDSCDVCVGVGERGGGLRNRCAGTSAAWVLAPTPPFANLRSVPSAFLQKLMKPKGAGSDN